MMKLVSYYYIENKNKMALKKKKEKKSICMYKLYEVSKKYLKWRGSYSYKIITVQGMGSGHHILPMEVHPRGEKE